jgi:hypothetical protein
MEGGGMTYKPLPATLKRGDNIACRKVGYDPPEVLEVLKVYDDGHILLCRKNGVRAFPPIEMRTLRDYDFELVEEGATA